jgi:hypothetical protein
MVSRGNLKERDYLEDVNVGWKIILKRILNKYDGRMWTGLVYPGQGHGAGCCELDNAQPLEYFTSIIIIIIIIIIIRYVLFQIYSQKNVPWIDFLQIPVQLALQNCSLILPFSRLSISGHKNVTTIITFFCNMRFEVVDLGQVEMKGNATGDLRVETPRFVVSTIHEIFYQVIRQHNFTFHLALKATLGRKVCDCVTSRSYRH